MLDGLSFWEQAGAIVLFVSVLGWGNLVLQELRSIRTALETANRIRLQEQGRNRL